MALACGNTVVLKSLEMCPATHRLIGLCFVDAGLPAGAVNVISNAPEDAAAIVKALIEAPAAKHVNFTGSTKVGRIIGRLAGEALKPSILALGGKSPLAIRVANDTEYGLSSAVFSRNIQRAIAVANRIESGNCPSTAQLSRMRLRCPLVVSKPRVLSVSEAKRPSPRFLNCAGSPSKIPISTIRSFSRLQAQVEAAQICRHGNHIAMGFVHAWTKQPFK